MLAFNAAEKARECEKRGEFCEAMQLFWQAINRWTPEAAPCDDEGQPELFWPELWTGSAMTLENVLIYQGSLVRLSPIA